MPRNHEILIEDLLFPESPRWHNNAFWFSDQYARQVYRVGADGKKETVAEIPGQPSGLGWLPDGRLLIVSMKDHRLLRLENDGALTEVAEFSALATHQSNDMVVDAKGRAYIGNFGFNLHGGEKPQKTNLVLAEPDGTTREVANEISFPNGTVITPDGSTLIVGETFAAQLTAFDVEPDGSLTNRRVWAETEGGVPDGISLDAEGAIWIASPTSAEVIRIREGGEVTERISVETQAFACMLGGADGKTLHVCTSTDSDPEVCLRTRSGRIETFEVDVPGAGLP